MVRREDLRNLPRTMSWSLCQRPSGQEGHFTIADLMLQAKEVGSTLHLNSMRVLQIWQLEFNSNSSGRNINDEDEDCDDADYKGFSRTVQIVRGL